jgi:hypothetical protein
MTRPLLAGLLLLLLLSSLCAQQPVNLRNTHERVVCIVPMIGRGTEDDPRRPMFAPLPSDKSEEASSDGIIAFTYQESDDGRYALVEFVAKDRAAFEPILAEKGADVKVFHKGKDKKADVQAEFGKIKRNFDIERFRVNVP